MSQATIQNPYHDKTAAVYHVDQLRDKPYGQPAAIHRQSASLMNQPQPPIRRHHQAAWDYDNQRNEFDRYNHQQ